MADHDKSDLDKSDLDKSDLDKSDLDPSDFAFVVRHTPLVSIDLIVRNAADEVLLGRRTNRPAQGWWFTPGGRIRKEERLADAFRRVSRDELGRAHTLDTARFAGVYEHLYDDNFSGDGFGTHYVVLAYMLRFDAEPGTLPTDQHGGYRWLVVPDLLASPDVHDNVKAYFR